MSQEILYTSAPEGLSRGSRGFCTVVSTHGMAKNVAERLESLSGYRHVFAPNTPEAKQNPVNYVHAVVRVGGQQLHVLSRVADAGLDYTRRSNKLAHHVAFTTSELTRSGPAWAMAQSGFFETAWDGHTRTLETGRPLPDGEGYPAGPATAWKAVTGDAGWAAVLAESATAGRPEAVIYPLGTNPLPLIVEAMALLPPSKRWDVTFSTYFTRLPPGVTCQWRFVLDGTQEATNLRRNPHSTVIDLCSSLSAPPENALTEAARTGKVEHPEPVAPARPRRMSHDGESPSPTAPPTQRPPEAVPEGGRVQRPRPMPIAQPPERNLSWVVPACICVVLVVALGVAAYIKFGTPATPSEALAANENANSLPIGFDTITGDDSTPDVATTTPDPSTPDPQLQPEVPQPDVPTGIATPSDSANDTDSTDETTTEPDKEQTPAKPEPKPQTYLAAGQKVQWDLSNENEVIANDELLVLPGAQAELKLPANVIVTVLGPTRLVLEEPLAGGSVPVRLRLKYGRLTVAGATNDPQLVVVGGWHSGKTSYRVPSTKAGEEVAIAYPPPSKPFQHGEISNVIGERRDTAFNQNRRLPSWAKSSAVSTPAVLSTGSFVSRQPLADVTQHDDRLSPQLGSKDRSAQAAWMCLHDSEVTPLLYALCFEHEQLEDNWRKVVETLQNQAEANPEINKSVLAAWKVWSQDEFLAELLTSDEARQTLYAGSSILSFNSNDESTQSFYTHVNDLGQLVNATCSKDFASCAIACRLLELMRPNSNQLNPDPSGTVPKSLKEWFKERTSHDLKEVPIDLTLQ